jgi:hypothetical protein
LDAPAQVIWHSHEEDPPTSWAEATSFPSVREALNAIVNGTPRTGHPWVRSEGQVFAPHQVEDLWREDRMM